MKTKTIVTALLVLAFTSTASAQDQKTAPQQRAGFVQGAYIDTNNNGICDSFEANNRGYGRAAGYGKGNGFRGGRGPAASQSTAYRQGISQGKGRGAGPAYGRGLGPGQGLGLAPGGMRFVDTNKNGICDSYETSAKKN
jgi:hypothetical protein